MQPFFHLVAPTDLDALLAQPPPVGFASSGCSKLRCIQCGWAKLCRNVSTADLREWQHAIHRSSSKWQPASTRRGAATCAIVHGWPSEATHSTNHSRAIDAADLVLRVGSTPVQGVGGTGGTRTSMRVRSWEEPGLIHRAEEGVVVWCPPKRWITTCWKHVLDVPVVRLSPALGSTSLLHAVETLARWLCHTSTTYALATHATSQLLPRHAKSDNEMCLGEIGSAAVADLGGDQVGHSKRARQLKRDWRATGEEQ